MAGVGPAGTGADGEDFVAGVGNEHFVFPLGGEFAVFGDYGPAVVEDAQVAFALVNHGFDGEDHAGLQHGAGASFAVVDDLRVFVEAAADTVAAKFLHHGITGVFGDLLAGIADVAEGDAGLHNLDTGHHALVGDVDQALRLRADGAHGIHAAGIAVEAVFFDGDVDVEDVAVFQGFVVGNAVADNVVYGGAAGFGEGGIAVVQWCGVAALHVDMIIVHQLVELIGGNAGFDEIADVVEGFGGQAAELAHFFDFFGGFDDDGHVVFPNDSGKGLPENEALAGSKLFQVALDVIPVRRCGVCGAAGCRGRRIFAARCRCGQAA